MGEGELEGVFVMGNPRLFIAGILVIWMAKKAL
jgi:hypothetical protein